MSDASQKIVNEIRNRLLQSNIVLDEMTISIIAALAVFEKKEDVNQNLFIDRIKRYLIVNDITGFTNIFLHSADDLTGDMSVEIIEAFMELNKEDTETAFSNFASAMSIIPKDVLHL